jgi:hypothetical protein
MELNDSQIHSHFGTCVHAKILNVQSFKWKGKQTPNWACTIPLEKFWGVNA